MKTQGGASAGEEITSFPFLEFDTGALGISDSRELPGFFWCERKVTAFFFPFSYLFLFLAHSLLSPFLQKHDGRAFRRASISSRELVEAGSLLPEQLTASDVTLGSAGTRLPSY